jgi:hypothetical protein
VFCAKKYLKEYGQSTSLLKISTLLESSLLEESFVFFWWHPVDICPGWQFGLELPIRALKQKKILLKLVNVLNTIGYPEHK